MEKTIEIPEGYEARIEGNKVILERKESEDERIRKSIVETIKQCPDTFLNPKNRDRMLAYLERHKENIVEWSAYDKATLEYIIEDIKSLLDDETDEEARDTFERELKLLRAINDSVKLSNYTNPAELQKEQKSAEWSEEDEKKLTTIISLMRSNRAIDPFYDKMCLESWLKSLRPQPHWKPSEEQMEELEYGIGILGNMNVANALRELYSDLKKL